MKLKDTVAVMRRAGEFLTQDIWDLDLSSLSGLRLLGVRSVRVILLVFRGFREDECPLHASALTFNTLMSIVPVLALSLALARGLGDTETARNKIRTAVRDWTATFQAAEAGEADSGRPAGGASAGAGEEGAAPESYSSALADEINAIVEEGFEKIENISFGALGGIGLLLLLLMVIQVLGRVEAAFNRVWGVNHGRTLWRKFTDYLSVLFILPVLVIAASSFPAANFAARFLNEDATGMLNALLDSTVLKALTVWLMSTLCFAFVLMFMPNTRVKLGPGFVGGLVTALLFLLWLKACAALQIGVAKWGRIYGSFAVVPIVLFWVYMSWQIIFFGAEVAFAVQNCSTYRMERGARLANIEARTLLALSIVEAAASAMIDGGNPFDISEFARRRRVPVRFLNDVVSELVEAGLLAELSDRQGVYALLKSPENLGLKQVVAAVYGHGVGPEDLGLLHLDPRLREIARRVADGRDASVAQMTARDLAPGQEGRGSQGV